MYIFSPFFSLRFKQMWESSDDCGMRLAEVWTFNDEEKKDDCVHLGESRNENEYD